MLDSVAANFTTKEYRVPESRRPTVHRVAGDGWPEQLNAENLGLSEKRRLGGETPFRARNVMVALGRTAVVHDTAPTRDAIRSFEASKAEVGYVSNTSTPVVRHGNQTPDFDYEAPVFAPQESSPRIGAAVACHQRKDWSSLRKQQSAKVHGTSTISTQFAPFPTG